MVRVNIMVMVVVVVCEIFLVLLDDMMKCFLQ